MEEIFALHVKKSVNKEKASLDDEYQATTNRKSSYQRQTIKRNSQGSKKYPSFDDDL